MSASRCTIPDVTEVVASLGLTRYQQILSENEKNLLYSSNSDSYVLTKNQPGRETAMFGFRVLTNIDK